MRKNKTKKVQIDSSIPATITTFSETEYPGITKGKLKVFHNGTTGDGREFTEEFGEQLKNSLPMTPILGYYDYESEDFIGHNYEQSVFGVVPENANIESVKYGEETFVVTDVALFTGTQYEFSYIADKIIGKRQSMELDPDTIEYSIEGSGDDRKIIFSKGEAMGLSVLGGHQKPAFTGSEFFTEMQEVNPVLKDFSDLKDLLANLFSQETVSTETTEEVVKETTTETPEPEVTVAKETTIEVEAEVDNTETATEVEVEQEVADTSTEAGDDNTKDEFMVSSRVDAYFKESYEKEIISELHSRIEEITEDSFLITEVNEKEGKATIYSLTKHASETVEFNDTEVKFTVLEDASEEDKPSIEEEESPIAKTEEGEAQKAQEEAAVQSFSDSAAELPSEEQKELEELRKEKKERTLEHYKQYLSQTQFNFFLENSKDYSFIEFEKELKIAAYDALRSNALKTAEEKEIQVFSTPKGVRVSVEQPLEGVDAEIQRLLQK